MHTLYDTRHILGYLLISILLLPGCKKFVEPDLPIDKNTAESVFSTTGTAAAVLSGLYFTMGNNSGNSLTGERGISVYVGLAADEFMLNDQFSIGGQSLFLNAMTSDVSDLWDRLYSHYIFTTNSVIEGVTASTGIPAASKKVLLGEAQFLRAFCYFYLVNLYGNVPLVTGTDFKINSKVSRSPKAEVYELIVTDLLAAQEGLSDNYLSTDLLSTTTERVRPNKAAATALLARVYLYLNEWAKAENEATKVISKLNYLLTDINSVFLKNSMETIWQVQPNSNGEFNGLPVVNTLDGAYFIPENFDEVPKVGVSESLLLSFEAGDQRKDVWCSTVFAGADPYIIPYKYKLGVGPDEQLEYQMVLRLSEQYLIRAEARARQGKLTGAGSAQEDLDAVRNRAGLAGTTAASEPEMLEAIEQERRFELFSEWGDRWLNLKRTGKIDAVMNEATPVKGGTWEPFKALFPVPFQQIRLNTNLNQNAGYPSP